ncbi:MAG: sugar phosphate isomerase/epimerase [Planctomycetes bacterium]|nr:sugar phosphate isomerase/epimerase [Planctomycetota bacterium]
MQDLPLGAVIAFDFKTWDVREEIALLQEVGIRRVQIYRNYAQGISADAVRRTLDAAGLVPDSLHGYFSLEGFDGPPCDLSAADERARLAALDIMRSEAQYARTLGCRDIIIHPAPQGDTQNDLFRPAMLASSARVLADIGRRSQVRFLIENMPPPMFGRDAAALRRAADGAASPHVGLAYDSGHAALAGDAIGAIHAMGPRLWGVHLHDTRGTEDDHLIPGLGVVPFEDVAHALAQVGYSGTFILEVYRTTAEVRRDLTPERLAFIEAIRRRASGRKP